MVRVVVRGQREEDVLRLVWRILERMERVGARIDDVGGILDVDRRRAQGASASMREGGMKLESSSLTKAYVN